MCLTSNDTEELLDPHVDVDPAEELVHVAPPLLQDGAGRLAGLHAGNTGNTGNTGNAGSSYVSVRLTCKHFAEPAQHQLQPLLTQKTFKVRLTDSSRASGCSDQDGRMFYLLELQQEGALVFAPAVLLHPLLDELVQDGGDGLGADPLQQLEFRTTHT